MKESMNTQKFACIIARFLDDKLASNISILNISNVSSIGDFFVIASADSPTQVKSLMMYVKEMVKKSFERQPVRMENDAKNRWNLLDYGDVIVHILHKDERETYALEKFWSHAFSIPEDKWMKESEEYSQYKSTTEISKS